MQNNRLSLNDNSRRRMIFSLLIVFAFSLTVPMFSARIFAQTENNNLTPVELLIRLADFYVNNGELDKAVQQLDDALNRDPGNKEAERLLLKVRTLQRGTDDSGENKPRTELKLLGGGIPKSSGQTGKNVRPKKKLSFQEKLKRDAAMKRGLEMTSTGNPDRALKEFQTVLSVDPDNMDAIYQIGLIRYNQGRLKDALKAFKKVTDEGDATDPGGFFWLANTYYSLRDYDNAEKAISRAVELDQKDSYSYALMGRILFAAKKYSDAKGAFLNALTLMSTNAEAMQGLGKSYIETGQLTRAEETLLEYVRLYPEAAEGYVLLARIYMMQGMKEKCIEMVDKAEALISDSAMISFIRGEIKRQEGGLIQAIELYKKAIQKDPYLGDAYFALVKLNVQIGKFNEALSYLDQAESKVGRQLEVRLEKGLIYERQNMMQQAMTEYEVAVKLAPKSVKAHMKLAEAYAVNEWYLDSIDQYNKVLDMEPDHPKADWIKTEISRLKSLGDSQVQTTRPSSGFGSSSSGGSTSPAGGAPSDFF